MKYVCEECGKLVEEPDAVADYKLVSYGGFSGSQYRLCHYHESCWIVKKKDELEKLEMLKQIVDAQPKKKWLLTTNIGKLLAARDKELKKQ